MKAKLLIGICTLVLAGTSCKKSDEKDALNMSGIDVAKATKSNYFFEPRVIDNDDDVEMEIVTKNSEMFANCDNPKLTFNKNNSYSLTYYEKTSGKLIKEIGTWATNTSTNELIMYRPAKRYNLLILELDQEDFVVSYKLTTTVNTTSSEGVISSTEETKTEILYMEDVD